MVRRAPNIMTGWRAVLLAAFAGPDSRSSPLHQTLVDRIAMLTAQNGGGAPIPTDGGHAGGAAERQSARPGGLATLDPRLCGAGQSEAAKRAHTARKTFSNDKNVMAALEAEASELKLN